MTTQSPPASQDLVPAQFPLWGSRLIEASAGTGKTWTIAALYLRLVLGHGGEHGYLRPLVPSEILVMTFTRAATRELSDRIRARLLTAARCFRGDATPAAEDDFLRTLIADYPDEPARMEAAWRLAMAAEGMDEAAIHTIDAWCQRMLREHAFDSGCLFDEELITDETELLTEAVQDYWRQECYPLTTDQRDRLLAIWPQVDNLLKEISGLFTQDALDTDTSGEDDRTLAQVLDAVASEQDGLYRELKAGWAERAERMLDWLAGQLPAAPNGWNGRQFQAGRCTGWLTTLQRWAQDPAAQGAPDLATGWERLTPQGLLGMRTAGAPTPAIPAEFQALAELKERLDTLGNPGQAIHDHAQAQIARRLLLLKQRAGTFGFADMLHRLHAALIPDEPGIDQETQGERLRERILGQYPVALIDEFQDTSPLQYSIFDRVYRVADNDPQTALLLIGDPKQSIYGFRGADIYSYLRARAATAGRHYQLAINYRSTDAMVAAVNRWFGLAEAQRATGAFMFGEAGKANPLPFVAVSANGRPERFVVGSATVPAITLVHDLGLQSNDRIRRLFAERCAEQIVAWLNDPQTGFVSDTPGIDQGFVRLCPKDVAVLVRTGTEAAAVRHELQRRQVASVYLSDKDSVYQSDEARDLVHWLRAVARPQDAAYVRAALATRTMGLDLDELVRISHDDEAFDERSERMRQLQQVWQTQGVLAMLRQSLHAFQLPARWLALPDGERRLTNVLHLAELLQSASSDIDGEQALIRWLVQEVAGQTPDGDDQVVRLESDADLVKVVTIHKSKGLEYPVVFLPYATSFREVTRKHTSAVFLPDPDGTRRLVQELRDEDLRRADEERLREDLRLLYVALTRPCHALWLGLAAVKVGNAKACQTHKSAAGYLLGGPEVREAGDWLAPLQALAQTGAQTGAPAGTIALQPAAGEVACTRLDRQSEVTPLQEVRPYAGAFDRDWTIASYTRLTRDLQQQPTTLSVIATPRPSDDELGREAAGGSPLPAPAPLPGPIPIWHGFTRGPLAGNFLHELLEWLATEGFALSAQLEHSPDLARHLRQRCQRAGYGEQAEALVEWLTAIVQTPLTGLGVALSALQDPRPEMEFWLPVQRLVTAEVDALCAAHLLPGMERPALQDSVLHGMLMGFADLVFEHGGRYWVLDYKSNHLGAADGDYNPTALGQAMATHRYDVQAAIYLLALHRLLGSRLGRDYDPARHLGGALYLFLRGIHGPGHGVYLIPAAPDWIAALDTLLGTAESER